MKKVKRFFAYILYWFLTIDDRHLYEVGKIRGHHCDGFKSGPLDSYRDYYYDTTRKPQRNFLTFKEFMNR